MEIAASENCNVQYNTNDEQVAMKSPTQEIYSELQRAYEHFNQTLFDSQLPPCLLTVQRKDRRVMGYFSPMRFVNPEGGNTDEIAMNPMYFASKDVEEVMQTLVHEMTHLWQYHLGEDKSRMSYHNKEWGNKMESIGLMPSSTGKPGGKRTGQRVADYQIQGGLFEKVCRELLTKDFRISWCERFQISLEGLSDLLNPGTQEGNGQQPPAPVASKPTRVKYTCSCGKNVWGKPGLNIICGECEGKFSAQ